MQILMTALGWLWILIAGGSTVLIVRDGIRRRGSGTTPKSTPIDDLPTGYQAAENANRKPVTFRYDQPHAMKLPHWYSK